MPRYHGADRSLARISHHTCEMGGLSAERALLGEDLVPVVGGEAFEPGGNAYGLF